MRWPRGKYNGRRIEGFKVSLHLHLLRWYLIPRWSVKNAEAYCLWLCWTVRAEASYR